jgi:hypothetical protein
VRPAASDYGDVSQLSPPFRIALVAVLGVAAVWLTVLRPKPVESTPAPAPAPAQSRSVAPAASATAAPATTTKPKAAPAPRDAALAGVAKDDRSRPLIRALADGKVVVLLFWDEAAPDDRAARRAVAAADTHRGAVVVRTAKARDVGRYQAITKGAQVAASPTALVIGPRRTAKAIVGYTTTPEVDNAVSDALAARR